MALYHQAKLQQTILNLQITLYGSLSLNSLEINTDAQADDIGFSTLRYSTSGGSKV